ncbi:MAG: hypothetical protein AAFR04_07865 [Pseudomonadota bacterium]
MAAVGLVAALAPAQAQRGQAGTEEAIAGDFEALRLTALGQKRFGRPITPKNLNLVSSISISSSKARHNFKPVDCEVLGSLPNLKFISLGRLSLSAACARALARAPRLERLSFSGTTLEAGALRAISKLPGLTTLVMYYVTGLRVEEASDLRNARGLRSLSITQGDGVTGGTRIDDTLFRVFAGLPISELYLRGVDLTDASASVIAGLKLNNLRLVDTQFTTQGLQTILEGSPQLRTLQLRNNRRLTSALGPTIAGLTQLQNLDLTSMRVGGELGGLGTLARLRSLKLSNIGVTNDDLTGIAASPSLTSLQLSSNPTITDKGYENLAKLTALRTINLSGSRPTIRGVRALSTLPELTTLDLSEAQLRGDLSAILARFPKLTSLALSGNAFDRADITRLLKRTRLRRLSIYRTRVTKPQAKAVRKQFPRTRILHY